MPALKSSPSLADFLSRQPEETSLRDLSEERQTHYRGYQELLQSWADLPNARAHVIGHSRNQQPLWMIEIGNPHASKVSVVLAGVHPIEWIGMETALRIAQEHALDPCPDRRVLFFPMANPDGFQAVEKSLRDGKRKWVRGNAAGVDLNRNWPTYFKMPSQKGEKMRRGKAALSEPETRAIVRALDAISSEATIDIALSLHSIGKMILMPWGGLWQAPVARASHLAAAKAIRQSLPRYTIRQVSHWLPGLSFAHGMDIDHLHKAYGATSILVECSYGQLSLLRPKHLLHPFRIFNPHHPEKESTAVATAVNSFIRGQL